MLLLCLPWLNPRVYHSPLSDSASPLQIFILPKTYLWISYLLFRSARWPKLCNSLAIAIKLPFIKRVFWSHSNLNSTSTSPSGLWSLNTDWKWVSKSCIIFCQEIGSQDWQTHGYTDEVHCWKELGSSLSWSGNWHA